MVWTSKFMIITIGEVFFFLLLLEAIVFVTILALSDIIETLWMSGQIREVHGDGSWIILSKSNHLGPNYTSVTELNNSLTFHCIARHIKENNYHTSPCNVSLASQIWFCHKYLPLMWYVQLSYPTSFTLTPNCNGMFLGKCTTREWIRVIFMSTALWLVSGSDEVVCSHLGCLLQELTHIHTYTIGAHNIHF